MQIASPAPCSGHLSLRHLYLVCSVRLSDRAQNELPFSTCLHDDESAASFASRLAWVNGIPSIVDLFTDARLSLADFLKGDPSTLMELAALGDVPVQRLTHRAFILKGKSSFEIAGHEISQHKLLRGIHRICPACFRADTGGHIAEQTLPNAYGRILWSLASARVCPIHHLRLIAPPEDAITHEFLQSWVPWLPEILAGELDELVPEGGAFEAHVALRLAGARTTSWASEFPIDALGAACEMLGVSRSFGKEMTLGALTQTQLATATSVGFTLLVLIFVSD
jgi:hypothetical protein